MDISVTPNGAHSGIVTPTGRLDLLSAADVKKALTDAVSTGMRHVVVDLSAVPFIDSSGLGALIGGLRAAREAGGDLRIACLNDQARTVLKLTTLDRVLVPYERTEDALAAFNT